MSEGNNQAVQSACCNVDAFRLLIELGGDVTLQDFSVLRFAASSRDVEVMRLLLAYGGDAHVTACNNDALHGAVSSGCVEMVKILVDHGADLYAPWNADRKFWKPFRWNNVEIGEDWAFFMSVMNGHVVLVK